MKPAPGVSAGLLAFDAVIVVDVTRSGIFSYEKLVF